MLHVVMFSGGIGSWYSAWRVRQSITPADDLILLFADTLIEDQSLYDFLEPAADSVRGELIRIQDGRTPWQVMTDSKVIGNTRIDPCSKILKRQLLDAWRDRFCNPVDTIIYVGIDWTETHRLDSLQQRTLPWNYQAPLCDPPYVTKADMLKLAASIGLPIPRLYQLGFAHNNCGGFCIKAGQAQFQRLLETMPARYAMHEAEEQKLRAIVGDHAILRDRSGGTTRPLTLREFRQRLQGNPTAFDSDDWGGCGCAID